MEIIMKNKFLAMLVTASMVLLTACGTASDTGSTTTAGSTANGQTSDSSAAASADSAAQTSAASQETFVLGFDQNFPPMGFIGDDGEYTGFDIDLAKAAVVHMGMKLELRPISWDSKDMELSSGTIDCIWNGFTMSGREDGYEWTTPYMKNNQVIVVKADSTVTGKADLAGKVAAVQVDSSGEAALNADTDFKDSLSNVIIAEDYDKALMDLEMGAVDAVIMDEIVAKYQIEQRAGKFKIVGESLAVEEYGVGFLKGNTELRDKLQAALDEMAKDGTMAQISQKWFGEDITTIK